MHQTQGSRSGRQTGAGHTPSMARSAVTALAEADVSARKTFHNRRVQPQRLLTDASNGNTVYNYVFPMLATLPAETLSLFSRPPDLENALEIYARLQNLWLNTALRRLLHDSTHDFLLFCCWCCLAISTATQVWRWVQQQQCILAERGLLLPLRTFFGGP